MTGRSRPTISWQMKMKNIYRIGKTPEILKGETHEINGFRLERR
jgi:hypothetical protein